MAKSTGELETEKARVDAAFAEQAQLQGEIFAQLSTVTEAKEAVAAELAAAMETAEEARRAAAEASVDLEQANVALAASTEQREALQAQLDGSQACLESATNAAAEAAEAAAAALSHERSAKAAVEQRLAQELRALEVRHSERRAAGRDGGRDSRTDGEGDTVGDERRGGCTQLPS
jgi:chromosome segregation ATPase